LFPSERCLEKVAVGCPRSLADLGTGYDSLPSLTSPQTSLEACKAVAHLGRPCCWPSYGRRSWASRMPKSSPGIANLNARPPNACPLLPLLTSMGNGAGGGTLRLAGGVLPGPAVRKMGRSRAGAPAGKIWPEAGRDGTGGTGGTGRTWRAAPGRLLGRDLVFK
jgi:hypothetical protein